METYELSITSDEIIEATKKKRSTFYDWRRRCPVEYLLIKEALLKRKLEKALMDRFYA